MTKTNNERSITEFPLDELIDDLVSIGQDLQSMFISREMGYKTLYGLPLDEVEENCKLMTKKIKAEIHRRVKDCCCKVCREEMEKSRLNRTNEYVIKFDKSYEHGFELIEQEPCKDIGFKEYNNSQEDEEKDV